MQAEKTPLMLKIEQRFGKNLEEILKEEYVVNRINTYDLAKNFKVGKSTIHNWLRESGIQIRTANEVHLPAGIVKPSREQLKQLYVDKCLTAVDIAKQLGTSGGTVLNWLRKYGFHVRNPSEIQLPTGFVKPTKEQLKTLYVDERMTPRDIGKQLGVSTATVRRWIYKCSIPRREISEARLPPGVTRPSKEKLYRWYVIDHKNTTQIANSLKIGYTTVINWLKNYNIQRRNASEAQLPSDVKRPSNKELRELYVVKGISTISLAKSFDVTDSAVGRWLKAANISMRHGSNARMPNFKKPSKNEMHNLYVRERKGAPDIARELGVSQPTVLNLLREYNIQVRTNREAHLATATEVPSEEQLRKLYIDDRLSTVEIGKKLGVTSGTICHWLRDYEIKRRGFSEAQLPTNVNKPSKEQLMQWYADNRMSANDIGKKLGVTGRTIGLWLREYAVQRRNISEAKLPPGFVKPSKEELQRRYVNERMSMAEISKKLNISSATVSRLFHEYHIPIRSLAETRLPAGVGKPSKEELRQWYVVERRSTIDIAEQLGVCNGTVGRWLRDYDISMRSISEARLPPGFVKPSEEQLRQWYIDERISPARIAEKLSVSPALIRIFLQDYNIRKRNGSEARLPPGFVKPSEEQLRQWYIIEQMSAAKISKRLGVSEPAVYCWLHGHGIHKQSIDGASKDAVKELLKSYVGDKKYAS